MWGVNKISVGYFAQHQLDELSRAEDAVWLYDRADARGDGGAAACASSAHYGFSLDKADTKCGALSGGEKARLLLMRATFHAPHLIILDEPTNHLDVDSREALVRALAEYKGAVILISHDRHLVDASADRLWIVRSGTVKPYDGDMDSYRAELLAERGTRAADKSSSAEIKASRADERRLAAERRAELAPLRKRWIRLSS